MDKLNEFPGTSLEEFLCWDLVLSDDEIGAVVKLYEPYRGSIEMQLKLFDERLGSWKNYSTWAFDFIPSGVDRQARLTIRELRISKKDTRRRWVTDKEITAAMASIASSN